MTAPPPLARLLIVGVGLIGGSLARALRRAGFAGEIIGCGRSLTHLERAVELGVIDQATTDLAAAAAEADGIVLCVPVLAIEAVLRELAPHLRHDAIITDVGSTKGSVVAAARAVFGTLPANFVPGHPIAGTERNGVEASFAELFDGRRVILTPEPETGGAALERVRELWQACGADVVEMSAEHHDQVLAETSHLPHVLAYTLVDNLARKAERREIFRYAAGGFRDFTRIASSDPAMWRDICLANRAALGEALRDFRADLDRIITAVEQGDESTLIDRFSRAKTARDRFTREEP